MSEGVGRTVGDTLRAEDGDDEGANVGGRVGDQNGLTEIGAQIGAGVGCTVGDIVDGKNGVALDVVLGTPLGMLLVAADGA